jgi:hypothetical protein
MFLQQIAAGQLNSSDSEIQKSGYACGKNGTENFCFLV